MAQGTDQHEEDPRTAGVAAPGPKVFVSYRRADTGDVARALSDRLREDLGGSNVFRDEDDLIAGRRWNESLEDAIKESDVAAFLIGPEWTGSGDIGARRIDREDDPVGAEARQALRTDSRCEPLPILVDLDSPPPALPNDVQTLFDHHAVVTSRDRILDSASKDYQSVLVGVWEALRQRTPRGVLIIGDGEAQASLDAVVEEMKDGGLIDARKLSRFASGAYIVSTRRLRRRARKWPDAIILVNDGTPSATLQARIKAINEHPSIRNVSLVGAGIIAGFALSQVLGSSAATAAGSGTSFTASTQIAAAIPQAGTGPLAAASAAWAKAAFGAKAAVAASVAVVGVAGVVATQIIGDDALPLRATYGFLEVEVTSARSISEPPEEIAVEDPAVYVAVDVTLDNPVRDFNFSLPPGIFTMSADGETAFASTIDGEDLAIESQDETSATLWFRLPDGTSIDDPTLVIRERGAEPLVLSLTKPSDVPERVPVSMSGDYETECRLIEFGPGFASYNAGITDLGDRRPGPSISVVGRAAENEILVSFDIRATERCPGSATFFNIRYQIFTAILESRVGERLVNTADNEPFGNIDSETLDLQLAASVPEDSTLPLEIDFDGPGEEIITLTTDLSGIAALIASE